MGWNVQLIGTSFLLFAVPRVVANFVDPAGRRIQRSVFDRFWTITVPDNSAFFALIWAGKVQWRLLQDLSLNRQLAVVTVLALLILFPAKVVELVRLQMAKGLDWISKSDKLSKRGRDLAFFLSTCIGPRDFYALNSDRSRPLFGLDWLFQKMGLEDDPKGSQLQFLKPTDPLLVEASLREASARGEPNL